MKQLIAAAACAAAAVSAPAATFDSTDATAIQAFQQGLSVEDFESVAGRTPQAVTSFDPGQAVDPAAFVFDEIAGVRFSVGGTVGVNRPALFDVGASATSGSVVLGPVDFDGTTQFEHFIEVFFPVKVARVGFWANPALGPVQVIAANTNFAFSGKDEVNLETLNGAAGHFVGFERASADIGGLKIFGFSGFTIDDFSFGVATPVPEPSTWALMALGLAGVALRRRQRAD